MPDLTDEQCLAILTANLRDAVKTNLAMETLFRRYDRKVQCKLRNRCPWLKHDDLADLSQETWKRVWEKLDARIEPGRFGRWLMVVGCRLVIDLGRKKKSRPTVALGDQDLASGQADHVHELGFREELQRCVERLSPQHRAFLVSLFNLETAAEIAATLNRKIGRIHQIKHEIGQQLLGCLGWLP